jgi:hypothetical protein
MNWVLNIWSLSRPKCVSRPICVSNWPRDTDSQVLSVVPTALDEVATVFPLRASCREGGHLQMSPLSQHKTCSISLQLAGCYALCMRAILYVVLKVFS